MLKVEIAQYYDKNKPHSVLNDLYYVVLNDLDKDGNIDEFYVNEEIGLKLNFEFDLFAKDNNCIIDEKDYFFKLKCDANNCKKEIEWVLKQITN